MKKTELTEEERDIVERAGKILGRMGGSCTSPAKIRASRENGKLGGRPRKTVKDNTEPKGGK